MGDAEEEKAAERNQLRTATKALVAAHRIAYEPMLGNRWHKLLVAAVPAHARVNRKL